MGRLFATPAVKDARALGWSDVGTDEADLVRRCAGGDQAACAELVTTHERMVYQLAFHLLGTREEALDLSQEVFLRVFRTMGSFRGQSSLRTWIYRIVINQASNRQRWFRRRRQSDQVSLDAHQQAHGELPQRADLAAPDRLFARKEAAARLWQAMDRLPFDQRTAVVLREFDGLSYEEIAFSLDIAVGTVKSRLTRARQALRADLLEVRA
jgi:RNA polymerase sigma-70 factor (ECF subfamily)